MAREVEVVVVVEVWDESWGVGSGGMGWDGKGIQ